MYFLQESEKKYPGCRTESGGENARSSQRGSLLMRILMKSLPALLLLTVCIGLLPRRGNAIPAFARLYGTSCMTCHIDFPKLNDFGKAFKDAGFQFPKDEEADIKIPPV